MISQGLARKGHVVIAQAEAACVEIRAAQKRAWRPAEHVLRQAGLLRDAEAPATPWPPPLQPSRRDDPMERKEDTTTYPEKHVNEQTFGSAPRRW